MTRDADVPDDIPDRTVKVWRAIAAGRKTKTDLADELGLTPVTVRDYIEEIQSCGYPLYATGHDEYVIKGVTDSAASTSSSSSDGAASAVADGGDDHDGHGQDEDENDNDESDDDDEETVAVDLESVEPDPDADPSPSDLTDRERYIATELQTGATLDELTEDLDERPSVVRQHLRDLKRRGWQVYIDESAEHIAIEGEHVLRSSEHTGTRTRKANRWWELRHNALVREWRDLSWPRTSLDATSGHEDWVVHMTDLHAGDLVRRDDGVVVYDSETVGQIVDHITERALALADKHDSTYDAAHLLWGGDFITNEGIYEGQHEDLDAWLDEQHDILVEPLIRQLKAFSERFPTVQVVCQVGNHGQHRASGVSRQANADLIAYKTIRNTVAAIRDHTDDDTLGNVQFLIGEAKPFRDFELRGGRVQGHLRHGQNTKPQATTAAGSRDWRGWLLDHEFDVGYAGHHHVSKRLDVSGRPVFFSGSPKPADEFVEQLAARPTAPHRDVATAHGIADEGVTAVFPIDTRGFERETASDALSEWEWGPQ